MLTLGREPNEKFDTNHTIICKGYKYIYLYCLIHMYITEKSENGLSE